MYPAEKMPVVQGVKEDQADIPAPGLGSYKKEQDKLTDDLRREARQAYLASISFMDAQVGRVIVPSIDWVYPRIRSWYFTSDHGYHVGEHGLWQKMSLFEESSRVPLLIVAPGASGKKTIVNTPVSHVDLFPTLAELCNVPAPDNLQGQSLVSILRDPKTEGRGWALTQVMRGGGPNRASVSTNVGAEEHVSSSAIACALRDIVTQNGRRKEGARTIRSRGRSQRVDESCRQSGVQEYRRRVICEDG